MDSSRSISSIVGFNVVDTAPVEAIPMALMHVGNAMSGRALLFLEIVKNNMVSMNWQK
jgi:hypothetical protein